MSRFAPPEVRRSAKQVDKKFKKKLKIAFDKTNFYDILYLTLLLTAPVAESKC